MTTYMGTRYFELVYEFPLLTIKDTKACNKALAMMESLMIKETLTKAEEQYLETLSTLVSVYEAPQWQAFDETVPPHKLLAGFMKLQNVNPPELYPLVGGQSHLSEILNGKRVISELAAANLSKRFNVAPSAFRRVKARGSVEAS